MIKSDKIYSCQICQFHIAYNTNQFALRFYTVVEYTIGYLYNFVSEFFETLNMNSKSLKIKRYM
jgi:hypothetical protein